MNYAANTNYLRGKLNIEYDEVTLDEHFCCNDDYSKSTHRIHEEKIMQLVRTLDNYEFNLNFNSELYSKSCKYCEFGGCNKVCDELGRKQ